MSRKQLTDIVQQWRYGLITQQEYRLALYCAVQGFNGDCVTEGMRRLSRLRQLGVIG